MRGSILVGMALLLPSHALAQATMMVPTGGGTTTPVAQDAVAPPPDDDPREIAEDAARDLTPTRFYNRPGATRAEYDAAWQQCRLIARGSRTPSGMVPVYYNPAVISPIAAGIGGGLGGLLGAALAQGAQRRANRQNCMLIRGWRLVEPTAAAAAPVIAMTPEAREAHLNQALGAAEVNGKLTEQTSFAMFADDALKLDAPLTGPGSVFVGRKIDPAVPIVPGPDEAAIVVGFRRPDPASAGRSAMIDLMRYDIDKRDIIYRPRDWKAKGDQTTYQLMIGSGDKKAPYEVQVVRVTPGAYVLNAMTAGPLLATSTNCFGAPVVEVKPGEVAYLGDFIPYVNLRTATHGRYDGLVYAGQTGDAATTLATKQPALAGAMRPATWRNQATYGCSAVTMTRFDLNGVEALPAVVPPAQ